MPKPLLLTKLYMPPPRPDRVFRLRLTERLNEGLVLGRKLTLISAPAGFGKTTCVVDWLSTLNCPFTWLSLDALDDDPGRFFTYLIAALQKVDPSIGSEIDEALKMGQIPPLDVICTTLINDILSVASRFLLVLDDFQTIQHRSILEVIDFLIANQPEQLHIVMITREDPLLPLARMRAKDQVTEIRAGDLRFTNAESSSFLNEKMGLTLTADDIITLENRTEGWAVGLQLAGLSMRGREDPSRFIANLSGNHRFILNYLTEEVLNQQSEEVQTFLLQTSILNKFTGDLCDAITGRTDSGLLLEKLYTGNLFLVSLDDVQLWYRYHHLFADLLRSQQNRISKEQMNQLHWRASQWFAQTEMPAEAIRHALAAEDYALAVNLIEQYAMPMIQQGYVQTVEGWMQSVPSEWHLASPRANLAFAWMYLLRGNYDRIPEHMERIQAALVRVDRSEQEQTLLQAEWHALQAGFLNVIGKTAESIEHANRTLQLTTSEHAMIRSMAYIGMAGAYRQMGDYLRSSEAYQNAIQYSRATENPISEMLAVANLALMAIQHGELRFAAEIAERGIENRKNSGKMPPIAASVYGALGLVCYEWNQLERAQQLYEKAAQLALLGGHNAALIFTMVLKARLQAVMGNVQVAAQLIGQAADLLPRGAPLWVGPEVISTQVQIYLNQDSPVLAENVLKQLGIFPLPQNAQEPNPALGNHLIYLAAIRYWLYQARRNNNFTSIEYELNRLSQFIENMRKGQFTTLLLQGLLMRAQLYDLTDQNEQALNDLAQALLIAEPEGYIRIFVDAGVVIKKLLFQVVQVGKLHPAQQKYAEQVIAVFPKAAPRQEPTALAQELDEPLSEREIEVLRFLADGLKYDEIAEQLVVSVNTVRFYVKEIYSKLQVNNRTKAVETARKIQLI